MPDLRIDWPTVPLALLGSGLACPNPWPEPRYRKRSVYFARGPARTLKIGLSACPVGRCRVLGEPAQRRGILARLGETGPHRLLLEITNATVNQERALHRIVAHERVSGEWFRGPDSEFLLATLALAARRAATERAA